MPELPDITVYIESLESRIVGKRLEKIRLASPFVIRTVDPPHHAFEGNKVLSLRRIGKRIIWSFENSLFLVFHLMIAGRFHWKKKDAKPSAKIGLAAFDFLDGTLMLTEASSKKRASIHCVRGENGLAEFNRGGIEPLSATLADFQLALKRENHTLKRSLTDPTLFSAIGNAYSDEILHRAQLSPLHLTQRLTDPEIARLYDATRITLTEWIVRLRNQTGPNFPEKVTAFHEEMSVHGKFGKPCPVCGSKVQRIVYAENECDYCARCQTGGRLLADRSLSRLLKGDWPKTIDEVE
jgi:formamidopyrimidine-DNA glycosylase